MLCSTARRRGSRFDSSRDVETVGAQCVNRRIEKRFLDQNVVGIVCRDGKQGHLRMRKRRRYICEDADKPEIERAEHLERPPTIFPRNRALRNPVGRADDGKLVFGAHHAAKRLIYQVFGQRHEYR